MIYIYSLKNKKGLTATVNPFGDLQKKAYSAIPFKVPFGNSREMF